MLGDVCGILEAHSGLHLWTDCLVRWRRAMKLGQPPWGAHLGRDKRPDLYNSQIKPPHGRAGFSLLKLRLTRCLLGSEF